MRVRAFIVWRPTSKSIITEKSWSEVSWCPDEVLIFTSCAAIFSGVGTVFDRATDIHSSLRLCGILSLSESMGSHFWGRGLFRLFMSSFLSS